MAETWTKYYNSIEDCYVPGDTMPPVKNEWRFRSKKFVWKVRITGTGDKPKKHATTKTEMRPVIKGNTIGIAIDNGDGASSWIFMQFSEVAIEKYLIKTRYRLISDDDNGCMIEYKDDEPVMVTDYEEW